MSSSSPPVRTTTGPNAASTHRSTTTVIAQEICSPIQGLTQGDCIIDWQNDEDQNNHHTNNHSNNFGRQSLSSKKTIFQTPKHKRGQKSNNTGSTAGTNHTIKTTNTTSSCTSSIDTSTSNTTSNSTMSYDYSPSSSDDAAIKPLTQEIFDQEDPESTNENNNTRRTSKKRQRNDMHENNNNIDNNNIGSKNRDIKRHLVENEVDGIYAIFHHHEEIIEANNNKSATNDHNATSSNSYSNNSTTNITSTDNSATTTNSSVTLQSNNINNSTTSTTSSSNSRSSSSDINTANKNILSSSTVATTSKSQSMNSVIKRRKRLEMYQRRQLFKRRQSSEMEKQKSNLNDEELIKNDKNDVNNDNLSQNDNDEHNIETQTRTCTSSTYNNSSFMDLLNDLGDDVTKNGNNDHDHDTTATKSATTCSIPVSNIDSCMNHSMQLHSNANNQHHNFIIDNSTSGNNNTLNTLHNNNNDEFDDPFNGGIEFNDDIFAAVDAAIHARTSLSQQQNQIMRNKPNQSRIQESNDGNNHNHIDDDGDFVLCRSPTLKTSNRKKTNQCNPCYNIHDIEVRPLQSQLAAAAAGVGGATNIAPNIPATCGVQVQQKTKQQTIIQSNNNKHPIQPIIAYQTNTNNNDKNDEFDEYGDFPMMDFDELDKQIENRQNSANNDKLHLGHEERTNVITPSNDNVNVVSSTAMDSSSHQSDSFIKLTRYRICAVYHDVPNFTQTLGVCLWNKDSDDLDHCEHSAAMQQQQLQYPIQGYIHLKGEWYHTQCSVGDIIHICSITGRCKTDISALPIHLNTMEQNDDLVLVHHPDELITPTSISEAVTCSRRAVLKMRLGSSGLSSKAAVIGQMRHDLFEKCVTHNNFTLQFVRQHTPNIVRDHAEQLIGCGIYNEHESIKDVMKIQPQIQKFAQMYMRLNNANQGNAYGQQLTGYGISESIQFEATSLHDTEEGAISTELGLKGFVDATMEVKSKGCAVQRTINGNEQPSPPQTVLMGIELKTGHLQNPQTNHVAQLSLYTLMLRSRYGSANLITSSSTNQNERSYADLPKRTGAANGGMLLYLNHESFRAVHVAPALNEIKSLISQRNTIATEAKRAAKPRGVTIQYEEEQDDSTGRPKKSITVHPAPPADLPSVLYSSHTCERCYVNKECMLVTAAAGKNSNLERSHGALLQHYTGHLDEKELEYFREWDRLIDLEAKVSNQNITKAWLMSSFDREKSTGRCMSSLIVKDIEHFQQNMIEQNQGDKNSFTIKLGRSEDALLATPLNTLKFEFGSRVVLSSDVTSQYESKDDKNFGILRGTVCLIESNIVHVRVGETDSKRIARMNLNSPETFRLRLDKDEFTAGTGTLRQNITKFLTADITPFSGKAGLTQELLVSIHDRTKARLPRLRRSIIHFNEPNFDCSLPEDIFASDMAMQVGGCEYAVLKREFQDLNIDQQKAIRKVLSATEYSIIQGFPGTGKTSTIAFLVRLLIARGKRILLSSYTHAAVDNLLLKLITCGVGKASRTDLIRIGTKSSCHPEVHEFLATEIASELDQLDGTARDGCKPSTRNLHNVVSSSKIVGATALTISKTPLLLGEHFDVVIIDEAGQISQPAILGPLMAADSFLLVGDHEQLPPLVQSESAEKAGHGISMMKRLADAHPNAVAQLTLQYRMHADICQLCNLVVYKGRLQCGNDDIRSSKLSLPSFPRSLQNIFCGSRGFGWLLPVLNPHKPVTFVNTDEIGACFHEITGRSRDGGGPMNEIEVQVASRIVNGLLICGLETNSIGIISPYRSQLKMLDDDKFLREKKDDGLEISTIDRYQGRDKEAIVISLVRSNAQGRTGMLLDDYRRINVALSRAKKKLIIIGSIKTLRSGSTTLQPILKEITDKRWMVTLPKNAIEMYNLCELQRSEK